MTEKEVTLSYRARYHTHGALTSSHKIWFVLHGYGQLSKFFLNKFNALAEAGVYVIAPEGLSKFYLEDVASRVRTGNNRVGATWMTRENRLVEIENYITYLTRIYEMEVPENFQGEVTLLGFSQGAATVTRWAIAEKISFHRLIIWAGIFPNDMNFEKAHQVLQNKKIIEVIGKQDPYFTADRQKEATSLHEQLRLYPHRIEFDGGHEINEDVLKVLI